MLRHRPFGGRLPTALNLLFVASMLVLAGGLAGALYEIYLGTPLGDLTIILMPTLFTGVALMLLAGAWKRRLDAQAVTYGSAEATPREEP